MDQVDMGCALIVARAEGGEVRAVVIGDSSVEDEEAAYNALLR